MSYLLTCTVTEGTGKPSISRIRARCGQTKQKDYGNQLICTERRLDVVYLLMACPCVKTR